MIANTYPQKAGVTPPNFLRAEHPATNAPTCLRDYAREKPEVVALWCFGIGLVLGWKLKPW